MVLAITEHKPQLDFGQVNEDWTLREGSLAGFHESFSKTYPTLKVLTRTQGSTEEGKK